MGNFLGSLGKYLHSSVEGQPPAPAVLQAIEARLAALTDLEVDASGAGIKQWLADLRSITSDQALHDTLVVRALQMHFPRLAEALTALGVVKFKWDANNRPEGFEVDWTAVNTLLSSPGHQSLNLLLEKVQKLEDLKALQALALLWISAPPALLDLEYRRQGFAALPVAGEAGFTAQELLDLIEDVVNSPARLPLPLPALPMDLTTVKASAGSTAEGASGYIQIDGPDAEPINDLEGLALDVLIKQGAPLPPIDLGNRWRLQRVTSTDNDHHYRLVFARDRLNPTVVSDGTLTLSLTKRPLDADALVLGESAGTHFAIQSVAVDFTLRPNSGSLFDAALRMDGVRFVLKPDFLRLLSFGVEVPDFLRFHSDIAVNYMQGKGLSAQGSADGVPSLGLEFSEPLNLSIGSSSAGLRVEHVVTRLELALDDGNLRFRANFRYGARGQFGPLKVTLDGAGIWFGVWSDGVGGLVAPEGIGLALDAGPVSGGGFLRESGGEYGGALQVKILGIGAFAYGLYKEGTGGEPAFVALIGIRFPPPGIQLGFGFAVSGFGGLVGINRRADTDRLRERLASGSAGDVLFNDNPLKNAPWLLGEMRTFFPEAPGVFLIGPTLKVNWLQILTLDAGIFIELPGPRQIFIAGSARLIIGDEQFALVYLRMDFIGGIDFTRSLFYIDAALVNSHVLGIFRVTGGMALRLGYGPGGHFLFSVGGFHPDYRPTAMELPLLARAGVYCSVGPVWLKIEMYLALTSSSFQLGFNVEAGLDMTVLSAHGWFRFDALIQLQPFSFQARIDAGFEVEALGISFCSVRVEGYLSGPGPLVLQARASVKRFGLKASGDVTLTLSNNPPQAIVPIPNLAQHLAAELNKADNLRFEGEDRSVVFTVKDGGERLFAPVGALIWEQKRVPLNLHIRKAEGVDLGRDHFLKVSPGVAAAGLRCTDERDWFSAGSYLQLSDAEALNISRFEEQVSGLRLDATTGMKEGLRETATPEIKLIKLPERSRVFNVAAELYGISAMFLMLAQRDGDAAAGPVAAAVTVRSETWQVVKRQGAPQSEEPLNAVQAFTMARRSGAVAAPAAGARVKLEGVF